MSEQSESGLMKSIRSKMGIMAIICMTVGIYIIINYAVVEEQRPMAITTSRTSVSSTIPVIDREVPELFETATFALG